MTPRERLLSTIRGVAADRVPLVLPGFECARRSDVAALTDPFRREIADRVFEHTVFRAGIPSRVNRMLVTPPQRIRTRREPLGDGRTRTLGSIETPKGELTFETIHDPVSRTSWQAKYPVESFADIDRIASVPWELPAGLAPPERPPIASEFPARCLVETRVSSPFVCVAGMMSYQWFLELCLTEPRLIADLTELCRQRVLACLEVLLATPAIDYVWLGGSEWVTPPMGSPALYDALVQEQEACLIDCVRKHSAAVVHIHCHGHVRRALERMIERGADYTEPVEPPPDGDITLAEAKALAAGRITLGGNIECRILCNEDEATVERAVRDAFLGGLERFVLRPTEGPSPSMSRREYRNTMRLVDLWEELSPLSA